MARWTGRWFGARWFGRWFGSVDSATAIDDDDFGAVTFGLIDCLNSTGDITWLAIEYGSCGDQSTDVIALSSVDSVNWLGEWIGDWIGSFDGAIAADDAAFSVCTFGAMAATNSIGDIYTLPLISDTLMTSQVGSDGGCVLRIQGEIT